MSLALGFCSGEANITGRFLQSLTALYAARPELPKRTIHIIGGPDIAHSRNLIVRTFLTLDADRLLMVDTDIVFTTDDVDRLLAHEEDVVVGTYLNAHGVLVVNGAGFMAIRRAALGGSGWFDHEPGVGEDISFIRRQKDVRVDDSLKVGHVKTTVLRP